MSKTSDIPPIGATNSIVQINQRNAKKQQQKKSKDEQQHEQAPSPLDTSDQHDSHTPSSSESHQGVDRYA